MQQSLPRVSGFRQLRYRVAAILGGLILFVTALDAQTPEELLDALLRLRSGEAGDAIHGPDPHYPTFDELVVKGEGGSWVWREAGKEPCAVVAKSTGEHPLDCRHCAGKEKALDLVAETPCHACFDGRYHCHVCSGRGRIAVTGTFSSGASPSSCPGCAGKGTFKCTVCRGRRILKFPRLKGRTIREAREEDIRKRLEDIFDAREALRVAMSGDGAAAAARARKYNGVIDFASGHVGLMAKLQKHEGRMKGFEGGASFAGEVAKRFTATLEEQVNREREILKIALQRLKRNAKFAPPEETDE